MSAFQPSNIAKKKELSTEKNKLPHDIQENINLKILHYIVAEARPLITVESGAQTTEVFWESQPTG